MLRSMIKGWIGEKATQVGMWLKLNESAYPRVHDLIVPTSNGTTQIDHVLVSVYGIFVIETKDYTGWIYGDERSAQWTVSHFGRKYRFQNPLRQNYRHIRGLSEYLGLDEAKFHSIVFFIGEAEIKTDLPRNVVTSGLSSYIRSFTNTLLTPEQAGRVLQQLVALKGDPNLTRSNHLKSLADRHDSTTV